MDNLIFLVVLLSQFVLQIFMMFLICLMYRALVRLSGVMMSNANIKSGNRLHNIAKISLKITRKRTKRKQICKKKTLLNHLIRHLQNNIYRYDSNVDEHENRNLPCYVVSLPPRENIREGNVESVPRERNEADQQPLSRHLRIQQPTDDGDESFIQQSYAFRLSTFADFPGDMLSTRLAGNGWYSTGMIDLTRCFFCHALHDGWRPEDDPGMFHNQQCVMSSGCHRIDSERDQYSENIPASNMRMEVDMTNMNQVHEDTTNMQCTGKHCLPPRNQENISEGTISNDVAVQEQTPQIPKESNTKPVSISSSDREERNPDEITPRLPHFSRTRASTKHSTCSSTCRSSKNSNDTPVTRRSMAETGDTHITEGSIPDALSSNNPDTVKKAPEKVTAPLTTGQQFDLNGESKNEAKYPSFEELDARISSYTAAISQTPRDLAQAGFFYAGEGDTTRCFFCGGGLRDWVAEDDPWVEHARWFPNSRFIIRSFGQQFVDKVQRGVEEIEQSIQIKTQPKPRDPTEVQTSLKNEKNSNLNETFKRNSNHTSSATGKENVGFTKVGNHTSQYQIICKKFLKKNACIVFLPCRHLACCEDCVSTVRNCPICGEFVKDSIKMCQV